MQNYLYKNKMKLDGETKAILTGSENLTSDKRKIMEDVFQCKVYDSYSLAEYVNYNKNVDMVNIILVLRQESFKF